MIVYKGRRLGVDRSAKKLPNGLTMTVEAVITSGGITILPIDKGNIVLVRQYRPVVERWLYELPAGGRKRGESDMECAKRELKEETGFTAKKMRYLFTSLPTVGYSTEKMHFYIASGLSKGLQELDNDEVMAVKEFTLKQALAMIRDGRIIDGKTIQGILYYSSFED